MTPLGGVVDERIYEQRIATIDLTNDRLAQVTPGRHVYLRVRLDAGWTILGGERGAWGKATQLVGRTPLPADSQSGEVREIYKPKLQIADPRVSPDGKNVAFIEGLMSDEGSTGGDVYVVPVKGGAAHEI